MVTIAPDPEVPTKHEDGVNNPKNPLEFQTNRTQTMSDAEDDEVATSPKKRKRLPPKKNLNLNSDVSRRI